MPDATLLSQRHQYTLRLGQCTWPDALICDIALCEEGGPALTRRIPCLEAQGDTPLARRLPAVALTGMARHGALALVPVQVQVPVPVQVMRQPGIPGVRAQQRAVPLRACGMP
ncbi:hypothetical protein ACS5PK_01515 [Roseateles sp. DB2]|uniref:hypothetical protein n=1 Tax=Roseateles sp. DB2 TaxID=3453717 RepID=UPI003EEB6489